MDIFASCIFATMQSIDTLLNARWVIPIEPSGTALENYSVAINNGRIEDLLPTIETSTRYRAHNTYDLDTHALIPGLINAHTHAAMSLLRGFADDLPLMVWLNEHIWPAEAKWVNEEFVHDGSVLSIAEMLRGGVTCFNDMYFFPDVTAAAAANTGMRICIGLIVLDFPTVWATDSDEYIHKGVEIHDTHKGERLINTAFAPHAPYTVSDETLTKIQTYATELDIPIHIHLHETHDEVSESQNKHGKSPIERLNDLGMLSPALQAVHMTQLQDHEIELIANNGAHVIHCPESNLKLASGFCPVKKLLDNGVNVALGTDGCASNNDLDMFAEMRTAALLAKGVACDAAALPAYHALRLATLNGARVMGLSDDIGSLEIGKAADIVAVDLKDLETQPLYHPISQLVYATSRDKVSDVWIAGRHILHQRELTTIDEQALREKTYHWQTRIQAFAENSS